MKAIIVTAEEVRMSERREYNQSIWDSNIDRMVSRYEDVVFYYVPKGDGFDYDRYFVEYTLPEGLRLFGPFDYTTAITNRGFMRLDKYPITEDGKTISDIIDLMKEDKKEEAIALLDELENSKLLDITYGKFIDEDGEECVYNNSEEARKYMIMKSRKFGMTFTKG